MRRGDEFARLVEGGIADGGQVEHRCELFGEMLNQMHFAVEMEDFRSQGAAFGFLGGQVYEKRCEGGGGGGRSGRPT